MNQEEKKLKDFPIKGEFFGSINLTDTFKKVKEIVNNGDRHNFLFINSQNESISHFDLYRLKDNEFPITIINTKRQDPYSGDWLNDIGE